ncbi:putative THO complex subunit 2 [Cocos nucifera]|uniref:Putative THO complex subunit 2 n=1 Tax=Cocos nucifera TaxID=13894 RepID=A0A8K0NAG7_COCNU|nr:putative THO complex subunit 2 [Cocos nucifera]
MSVQSPEFKYITEGCLREWKASNAAFKLPDPVPMTQFLYELCWAMIRGDLPFQKCSVALDSVVFVEEQQREEMASIIADVIAHMGQDVSFSSLSILIL